MKGTALVTGASSGIGRELAREFARHGHDLVLVARSKQRLEALAGEIRDAHGVQVHVIVLDLGKVGAAKTLHGRVRQKRLTVDILVHNAGFGLNGAFVENTFKDEAGLLQLNINALVELCHFFGREMVERRNGYIMNVASSAGFQPGPLMSSYYASKAFVLHFSEGIAEELRSAGVFVSALCPGATHSDFFERAGMQDVPLASGGLIPVMEARDVARIAYRGLERRRVIVIPGFMNKLLAFSNRLGPRALTRKIAMRINRKPN